MRPRSSAANGFTLVELMVTVGLLAFLGIMAASSFDSKSWLAHYRLKAAVRNLEMNFQFARMEAVKRNTRCSITFHQVLGEETYDYVVYVDDDANNPNPDIGNRKYDSGEDILRRVLFSDPSNPSKSQFKGVRLDTSQSGDGLTFANNADGYPSIGFNSRGLPQGQIGSAFLCDDFGNRLKVTLSMAGRIKSEPY